MAIQSNAYPLRIDKSILDKMKVIAALNGRSTNKEIEYRLKLVVENYEKENGEIKVSIPFE